MSSRIHLVFDSSSIVVVSLSLVHLLLALPPPAMAMPASSSNAVPTPSGIAGKLNKQVSDAKLNHVYNALRTPKGPRGKTILKSDDHFVRYVNAMDKFNDAARIQMKKDCSKQECKTFIDRVDDEIQAKGQVQSSHWFQGDMDYSNNIDKFEKMAEGALAAATKKASSGGGNGRRKRTLVSDSSQYFTQFPILYNADPNTNVDIVQQAVNAWQGATCLTFQQDTTMGLVTLYFVPNDDPNACGHSPIGLNPNGVNEVNIGNGCSPYSAAHEMCHSLGCIHEQSNPNSPTYVTVDSDNIMSGYEGNFAIYPADQVTTADVPYDLGSVMHYGFWGFAIDPSKPTLSTNDPNYFETIGQSYEISFNDAKYVNRVYCGQSCAGAQDPGCVNSGYLDPLNCGQCRCPEGLDPATNCAQPLQTATPCNGGQNVVIAQPGVPQTITQNGPGQCYILIQSSDMQSPITLTFNTLNFGGMTAPGGLHSCPWYGNVQNSFVTIKTGPELGSSGARTCGLDDLVNPTITTSGPQALLYYNSGDADYPGNLQLTVVQ